MERGGFCVSGLFPKGKALQNIFNRKLEEQNKIHIQQIQQLKESLRATEEKLQTSKENLATFRQNLLCFPKKKVGNVKSLETSHFSNVNKHLKMKTQ